MLSLWLKDIVILYYFTLCTQVIPHDTSFNPSPNPTSQNYPPHFTGGEIDAQRRGLGAGQSSVLFLTFLTMKKPTRQEVGEGRCCIGWLVLERESGGAL